MSLPNDFEDALARLLVEFADSELLGDVDAANVYVNMILDICEKLMNSSIETGKHLARSEEYKWLSN